MSPDFGFRSRQPCAATAFDHALLIAQKALAVAAATIAVLIIAKIFSFWWENQAFMLKVLATINPI